MEAKYASVRHAPEGLQSIVRRAADLGASRNDELANFPDITPNLDFSLLLNVIFDLR